MRPCATVGTGDLIGGLTEAPYRRPWVCGASGGAGAKRPWAMAVRLASSHAQGATPFILHFPFSEAKTARLSAAASWPVNRTFFRFSAMGRMPGFTGILLTAPDFHDPPQLQQDPAQARLLASPRRTSFRPVPAAERPPFVTAPAGGRYIQTSV